MGERRTPPSREPVYSEADVAEMRQTWDSAQEKRERNNQLARLEGQVSNLTRQLPEMVKSQVRIVLGEEKQREDSRRRSDMRLLVGFLGTVMVLIVPLENVLIDIIRSGRP